MKNIPIIYDQILYGNLSPWHEANKPDAKFIPLLSNIKTIEPTFQPVYDFDFIRHFNNKTWYYHKLIVNEANNYCNYIINLINADENENLKQYWINDTLNKKLHTRLIEIGKLIQDNDYSLLYINPLNNTYNEDSDHKTDTFVIQLLKTALIKVYLEIQEVYKSLISDTILEVEDFYTQLLFEPIPATKYIKSAQKVIIIEPITEVIVELLKQEKSASKALSFKYKKLATNSEAIKDLCDSLKFNDLIDKKTNLTDFKKIFSGEEINKPVVWTGNISDLYYFVALIHNELKYVENLKQQHWKVTCRCFIKPDNSIFEHTSLKTQKKPQINASMIEKVVALLK